MAVFSFSNVFALWGSFNNFFKIFKRCVYEIDSNVVCSINVANVSAGTSMASEGSF